MRTIKTSLRNARGMEPLFTLMALATLAANLHCSSSEAGTIDEAAMVERAALSPQSSHEQQASGDPGVGLEIAISAASSGQDGPAVGFNGESYLVAWNESRAEGGRAPAYDLRAALISTDGEVLDPGAIALAVGSGAAINPTVTNAGMTFVVVWDEPLGKVKVTRVSSSGELLDPDGLVIVPGGAGPTGDVSGSNPDAATDGEHALVVWESLDGNVWGCFVGADATVGTPIQISNDADSERQVAVSHAGDSYLVVWRSRPDLGLMSARVSGTGEVLGRASIAPQPFFPQNPNATGNRAGFFTAWRDSRSGKTETFANRVSPAGQTLDGDGLLVSAQESNARPAVASLGDGFLVAWSVTGTTAVPGGLFAARVASNGTLLDPSGFTLDSGDAFEADAANGPTHQTLVAYTDATEQPPRVHARLVDAEPEDPPVSCELGSPYPGRFPVIGWLLGLLVVASRLRRSRAAETAACPVFGLRRER